PKTVAAAAPTQKAAKVEVLEADPKSAEQRSPFVWIGAGAILLLCIAMLWFAPNNRLFAAFLRARNDTPVATNISPTANNPAPTLAPTIPPPPSPPVPLAQHADTHINMALEAWRN